MVQKIATFNFNGSWTRVNNRAISQTILDTSQTLSACVMMSVADMGRHLNTFFLNTSMWNSFELFVILLLAI